jgi:energy-coupling factor transport system permease protein
VSRPHPASLILLGLAVLLAATSREEAALFIATGGIGLVALIAAAAHLRLLLCRSRWLLLTMLLMFGGFTPGTPVPGVPGATLEGLLLAADNLARLLVALSVVALILKALPAAELVVGIRSLLAPLVLLRISRDRIAVRLALTLNEVEAARGGGDSAGRMAGSLSLPAARCGVADMLLGALSTALLLGAWLA